MDCFKYLVFLTFLGFLSTTIAVPIITHTTEDQEFYTINVDGRNELTGLAGLNVHNIIGTASGNDIGINYADYFSIVDSNLDGLLEFTFSNTDDLTELTVTAFYNNEDMEAFTHSLTDEIVDPPSSDLPPKPYVSEPSTLLLLGAGLIGIGLTRSRKYK